MTERFSESKGETGGTIFRPFQGSSELAPPRPLLQGETWGSRLREIDALMKTADAQSGDTSSFVKKYTVVPNGEGGQMLKGTEPFGGERAMPQHTGFVPDRAPITDINASLGRTQSAPPPPRGSTRY